MSDQSGSVKRAAVWKRGLATFLDIIMAFVVFGIIVALLTGGMTSDGFKLDGAPAFGAFALVAAYMYIGRRVLGGTLWDRIFGIARPQPE